MPDTFEQWCDFILNQHPKAMDLTLMRVKTVAEAMDLTHLKATVVTVAGTNGKGSVVQGLSSWYAQSNYRVGAFISPHLQHISERILIDHVPVDTALWEQACQAIWPYTLDHPLTFFEWLLLIALWIFRAQHCDLIILEVGLGGRLDATNVVDANLAIITKIALDHQRLLGDTLDLIAYEKAGICRAEQPVILGEHTQLPSLLAHLKQLNAQIIPAPESIDFKSQTLHPQAVSCIQKAVTWLTMQGFEQADDNALTVYLKTFQPLGRFSPMPAPWHGWLDVAHNPDAAAWLAKRLATITEPVGCLWFSYADKSVDEMVYHLRQRFVCWHVVDLKCARGDIRPLTSALAQHHITPAAIHRNMAQAYHAMSEETSVTTWVVWGGFEVVGEWLNYHDSISQ